jgi:regulator of sirC expression with transglutaminase-like and TPR domain
MYGVSFPGHFLVRVPLARHESLFVDPFDGKILERAHLDAIYQQVTGEPLDMDDRMLEPAGRRQVLARMLNNLRAIYEARGDGPRLGRMMDRLSILCTAEELRIGLEGSLQLAPDALLN